jgi:hypothetical protein
MGGPGCDGHTPDAARQDVEHVLHGQHVHVLDADTKHHEANLGRLESLKRVRGREQVVLTVREVVVAHGPRLHRLDHALPPVRVPHVADGLVRKLGVVREDVVGLLRMPQLPLAELRRGRVLIQHLPTENT